MVKASSKKCNTTKETTETIERKRLKTLALHNNLLSETPEKVETPLTPSKLVLKHHGADVLRKSQRKNRYLFSFPGLLAPVSGGKIGELDLLGTKNPILYLDFPQGRMKLFGTIVYPKNKYLTLQFSRGGKNVVCEDYFDNMIVFSDAWWIGTKDENPEEARLDFPKEMSEGQQMNCDFKGGAGGAPSTKRQAVTKSESKHVEKESPKSESEDGLSSDEYIVQDKMEITPVRQSGRNSGKKFNFAEISDEDSIENDSSSSEGQEAKVTKRLDFSTADDSTNKLDSCTAVPALKEEVGAENQLKGKTPLSTIAESKDEKPSQSDLVASKEEPHTDRGPLIQATIATLFKKVEEKKTSSTKKSASSKASGPKTQRTDLKRKANQAEGSRKKRNAVVEIESDTDGSDESWAEE